MWSNSRHQDAFAALRANLGMRRSSIDGNGFQSVIAHQLDDERREAVLDGDEKHAAACASERDIEQAAFFGVREIIPVGHGQQHDGIVLPP